MTNSFIVFISELETAVEKTGDKFWTVGNEAHLAKLRRKVKLEDLIICKAQGVDFEDVFAWLEKWDEPFSSKFAADNLSYREGFVLPSPGEKYKMFDIGLGILEFKDIPVSLKLKLLKF
jgi:hypothetical protein